MDISPSVCVVQFRMKECGVAEIVKSDAVVTASQSSHSSSSAPDILSAVKSSSQNGTVQALAVFVSFCFVSSFPLIVFNQLALVYACLLTCDNISSAKELFTFGMGLNHVLLSHSH